MGSLKTSSLFILFFMVAACPSSNVSRVPSQSTRSQGSSEPILNLNIEPSATNIAAGNNFLCGIKPSDHKIICRGDITTYWDDAKNMALPAEDYEQAKTIEAKAISAGSHSACIIRRDNDKLYCFGTIGSFEKKRLGSFTPDDAMIDVAVGGDHLCAVRKLDGKIVCSGDNSHGQLDNIPTEPVQAIAAGPGHTCAISFKNEALCWGSNTFGDNAPTTQIEALSLGNGFTCAIAHNGQPFCLGDIQGVPSFEVKQLTSKEWQTCALKKIDSTTICWGTYGNGSRSFAKTEPPNEPFEKIVSGRFFICGLKSDDTFKCWGAGGGQPMMNFSGKIEDL
jgi:alpha-tubulin suppressor-like RCC1 family protein